jgi:hypothetical protein
MRGGTLMRVQFIFLAFLCVGQASAADSKKRLPAQYLPIRERMENTTPGGSRQQDDVEVLSTFACFGGTQWVVRNKNPVRSMSASLCRHDDTGVRESRRISRQFVLSTIPAGQTLNLQCLAKTSYYELAWHDYARSDLPGAFIDAGEALVIVRNASRTAWVLNAHNRKSIQVEVSLGGRPTKYENHLLQPGDGTTIGRDGGVISARFRYPYSNEPDLPCSTQLDP